MQQIPVKKTEAFKQIARQLGARRAKRELAKAAERCCVRTYKNEVNDLLGLFVWSSSPQGHTFWRNIEEGRKPHHANL